MEFEQTKIIQSKANFYLFCLQGSLLVFLTFKILNSLRAGQPALTDNLVNLLLYFPSLIIVLFLYKKAMKLNRFGMFRHLSYFISFSFLFYIVSNFSLYQFANNVSLPIFSPIGINLESFNYLLLISMVFLLFLLIPLFFYVYEKFIFKQFICGYSLTKYIFYYTANSIGFYIIALVISMIFEVLILGSSNNFTIGMGDFFNASFQLLLFILVLILALKNERKL